MTTPAFGGKKRPIDPRDWDVGSFTPTVYNYPVTYGTDISWLPVDMQNQEPACGAFTGNEAQSTMKGFRGSPSLLWREIKKIDGLAASDGTNMQAIFTALKNTGLAPYGTVNEDTTVSVQAFTDPSVITPTITAKEGVNKISGYAYLSNITLASLKQAIYQFKGVLILIDVGSQFWTNTSGAVDWSEAGVLPLRIPSPIVDGHFLFAYAYDENYIYFRNHWSTAWGRMGNGYFAANYLPYVLEAGTLVEPTSYTFNNEIELGQISSDVYFLQKELNSNPLTEVAISGVGSPGNETYYFGSLTEAAVKKFQAIHSLPQVGSVGPLTRAALNKTPVVIA